MSAIRQDDQEKECCYIHKSGSFCIHMDIPPLDKEPIE